MVLALFLIWFLNGRGGLMFRYGPVLVVFVGLVLSLNVVLAADGVSVYAKCKACHGADGKGNPKMAEFLKVTPEQLDLIRLETQKKDDPALRKSTKEGVGKMKGLGDKLKDEEIAAVVAYLRILAKGK